MTSTTPDITPGLEWVKQRGMGALAEKMGIEWVEFSIDRCVATMPVEGNTQPVRSEEHTSELQSH